jgi:hypothetical protein
MALFSRMYDVRLLCMIYSIYRHDRSKSSVAVKYCSDCDESLCPDCFSVHGTFKAFISHHVIDAQLSADKSFELNQFCSDHKDMLHSDSSQSLQYLTATEDFVALEQGSQSCDEEAISFLKLNAKV